ncbi:MAG: efflux RND transporter periplasmic adaptor subunit [Pelomonas sp.]|nr:efflux RND transporter periplasmic adaptor subunit [Roseateles sp.]
MIRDTSAQDRPIARAPLLRRRAPWFVAGLVGLALLAWGAAPLRQLLGASRSVNLARLTVATVERGPFVRDVAGEGKVVAANSPTLYASNPGTVTLMVHAGDTVKTGDTLARIDSPDLSARLAQERSNSDAMRADLKRAEVSARQQGGELQAAWENARIDMQTAANDLDRETQAFKAGAAALMQVDHARDTLEKARVTQAHADSARQLGEQSLQFDVQAKQAALERQQLLVADLQRQVEALTLRAPLDGQVGQLLVAERASVAKDAPVLTVVDLTALEVQMQVPESFARDLAIGMKGEISANAKPWPGVVSAVSPEVVNNEVAARLRFDGARPDALRQNQRLSVRVLIDRRDNVLAVRRGSFADEQGGSYAYVLRDGLARKVPVRLGARSLDKVEVLSGLAPGDEVVIAGADAFDGAEQVAIAK